MASCCRRYRARRFKALGHDPQLLVIRPATPATSLDHLKPFKLSTALMAVHKDCYAPIGLIQQGGPRRRKTKISEADELKEAAFLLANLWESAQRLPEGPERNDAFEQIASFQRRGEGVVYPPPRGRQPAK